MLDSDHKVNRNIYPECAKTYTDNNFRIIGQARSSFHLGSLVQTKRVCIFFEALQLNNNGE